MKLYEITEVNEMPYFRKMRVESGFMYNFWNNTTHEYNEDWIFVSDSNDYVKALEHHEATTVGLWATDRPDLIPEDVKELFFEIK